MPLQQNTPPDDHDLLVVLRRDPDRAMPLIFDRYYTEVCHHIYRIVPNPDTCKDIAQAIFLELWTKRHTLDIRSSLGAYLHRMAITRALNYLRDNRKYRHTSEEELILEESHESSPLEQLTDAEMQEVITKAIDRLPARCRQVFVLSRFEGMSYAEIGHALDISPKTVENQISKAIAILRAALVVYHRGKTG